MNAADFIDQMQRMRKEGILKSEGRVFATHIAHDANPPHPQLVEFAEKNGYEIAFDGLVVDVGEFQLAQNSITNNSRSVFRSTWIVSTRGILQPHFALDIHFQQAGKGFLQPSHRILPRCIGISVRLV